MSARQRAPRREGHRTTLRVPDDVMAAAEVLAGELRTSTNDALIRLAGMGAADADRRRRAELLSQQRRAAVAQDGVWDPAAFPDEATLKAAMLAGRDEL